MPHSKASAKGVSTTQAARLTQGIDIDGIGRKIEQDENSTSAKLGGLIVAGQEKLAKAQSIMDEVVANEAVKIGKGLIEDLLAPAKSVLDVLDVVSQVHPAVSAAVGVFKVLVKMEMDRRDNDKHIAVLYHTMSDLLFVLSYLDPVFDHADKLKTMLASQLQVITKTMNDFGNFCEVYYKHKTVVRMVLSSRYKGKLADFAGSFTGQKKELQFLTMQKTAVTTVQMSGNLDNVAAKVDKIVAFLDVQTTKEKEVSAMIAKDGGVDAVIHNDRMLNEIAQKVGGEMTAAVKLSIRSDLDSMLSSNLALYNLKVEAATAQIQESVEASTQTILIHLDSGPHDLIEEPDIKAVWKEMNWRLSCKSRHFVDAVHHHYSQIFARHKVETGEIHPDHWTLKFLSKVIFYPAIGDAIDEDGSGYVSVHETNHFFNSKPAGWSSPQWLAYWAVGWYQNAILYKKWCASLLDEITESAKTVLSPNKPYVTDYLGKDGLGDLKLIVDGLYDDNLWFHGFDSGDEFESLDVLRKERREAERHAVKLRLEKTKYQLDSVAAVHAVSQSHQVEVHILGLIHLLLRRHKKVIELAQTLVLSENEFWTMMDSIDNLTTSFDERLNTLLECWRQQRLDAALQLECFAGGMFRLWNKAKENEESDSEDDYESDEESDSNYAEGEDGAEAGSADGSDAGSGDGSDEEADPEDVPDPENAAEHGAPPLTDILVYPLPPQPEHVPEDAEVGSHVEVASEADGEAQTEPSKDDDLTALGERVATMETRLANVEELLQEILSEVRSLNV